MTKFIVFQSLIIIINKNDDNDYFKQWYIDDIDVNDNIDDCNNNFDDDCDDDKLFFE